MFPLPCESDYADRSAGFWLERFSPEAKRHAAIGRIKRRKSRRENAANRRAAEILAELAGRDAVDEIRGLYLLFAARAVCFDCLMGTHEVCDPNRCQCCGDRGMKPAA